MYLNLLGNREQKIYGDKSLNEIEEIAKQKSKSLNIDCFFCQSNDEGEIINHIHSVESSYEGLIINPAALTHTSVAILDALRSINKPKIEIHLSNIYTREEYRKKSVTSEGVDGIICGFGVKGYIMALEAMKNILTK